MGTFGKWNQDSTVEPGMTRLSEMCNMDRKTIKKYRKEVIDSGYLKEVGTGKYNTTIYELTCPETIQVREKKAVPATSLDNLKKAPTHLVVDAVHNYKEAMKSKKDKLVVETFHNLEGAESPEKAGSCGNEDSLVVETTPVSCGNLPQEHKNNIKEEHKEHTTTPKVVVVQEDEVSTLEEPVEPTGQEAGTETSLNFLTIGSRKVFLKVEDFLEMIENHEFARGSEFSNEVKQASQDYYMNPEWEPKLEDVDRQIAAVNQAEKDCRKRDEIEW